MKLTVVFIFLIITNVYSQQEVKEFVLNNTVEIKSISPINNDYADLKVIGDAIGDAQVVLLGEQDHGDAPCFQAKTRIIKYLHEEKGFDVIAFECDMYALTFCNQNEIQNNLYSIWSKCEQNTELFNYLENSPTIITTGFDSRHSMPYTLKKYVNDFEKVIKNNSPVFFKSSYNKFKIVLAEIIQNEYKTMNKKEFYLQEYFYNCLDTISEEIKGKDFENKLFWLQEVKSLKAHAKNAWDKKFYDTRDIQMGDNILWLAQKKYPQKKIIVWAHNFHISKVGDYYIKDFNNLGKIVTKTLKEKAYFIGFNSHVGSSGRISWRKKVKVEKSKKEGFENWVNSKMYNYAFIDFTATKNRNLKFNMKGMFHTNSHFDWMNFYDGIFYIKEMFPCKKID